MSYFVDCRLLVFQPHQRRLGDLADFSLTMPLDCDRIQAILFDIDGTLSDTDDQFVLNLARWLRFGKFLFPRQDPRPFARWLVMKTETPGTYLFGVPDRLRFDDKLAHLGDAIYRMGLGKSSKQFILISGVRAMLASLSVCYPLAVVSARGERSARAFLNQYELLPFFSQVVTAQTCRYTKPYPDPILWAAQHLGVAPQNCLMVGDTTVDIRAGRAAGAQTVGVLCGFGEELELRKAGADLILSSTVDLQTVLLEPSRGIFGS